MDGVLPAARTRQAHRLTAGVLELELDRQAPPLFEVGERINPRRAFLFVSTVLGRHIPVTPAAHNAAVDALARAALPEIGPGPVLVMSYAETAVGLGANIARALGRGLPGRPILFLPTTRHPVPGREWFTFSEDHSHAQFHAVLHPATEHAPAPDPLCMGAQQARRECAAPHASHAEPAPDRTSGTAPQSHRGGHAPHPALGEGATLVLVDDETTTGTTFGALAAALMAEGLRFERVVLLTLTDWSAGRAAEAVAAAGARDVRAHALLSGRWHWHPAAHVPPRALPGPIPAATPRFRPAAAPTPFAAPRLGLSGPPLALPDLPSPAPGARSLVIGSGEHVWTPFLIAEAEEAAGARAAFLATTRSPILPGGPIRERLVFPDHFGLGIEMYLHNVRPDRWDRILLCTETGIDGVPDTLRRALGKGWILDGDGRRHPMLP